jgi:glycosyltransferase involved in cell wall biosynthesis
MRVLLVHNRYLQRGGEDLAFERERELLVQHGHEVTEWVLDNRSVADLGRVELGMTTIWSRTAHRELRDRVHRERPEIVHFHNTLPLVSPAAYWAARSAGAAVVQTLHNYRLVCPAALLYRDGAICELCVGRRVAWPAVQHGCYRGSRAASATVTAMLSAHRAIGTWAHAVDVYIALTEFARAKMIEGGLPADRIRIKPNFVAGSQPPANARRDGFLFVGRLAPEKGVDVLVEAWRLLPSALELRIVGDGPEAAALRQRASRSPNIRWLGALPHAAVRREMERACALLVPSRWYEVFPLVIVEALAAGLPVIASDIGSLASLVDAAVGRRVSAGDAHAWAGCVRDLVSAPDELTRLQRAARARYDERYRPERNHELLAAIYREAISRRLRTTNTPNATARQA